MPFAIDPAGSLRAFSTSSVYAVHRPLYRNASASCAAGDGPLPMNGSAKLFYVPTFIRLTVTPTVSSASR